MTKKAELVAHLNELGFPIPDDSSQTKGNGFGKNKVGGGVTSYELENVMLKLNQENPTVACQTGFNYGISALGLLCATDDKTQVYSYDLGQYKYVTAAHDWISKEFNGRHHLILGDSRATLKEAAVNKSSPLGAHKCGFVFVDGGHTRALAHADIVNFGALAAPGALLVVDDCPAGPYTKSVFKAVVDAKAEGVIKDFTQEAIPGPAGSVHQFRQICTTRYP